MGPSYPPPKSNSGSATPMQRSYFCGYTHIPRIVALPNGTLIVNLGSVGLPASDDASDDTSPCIHYMT